MSTASETWEADIYAKLSGDATLRAIVGTRIFPAPAPEGLTPGPFLVWEEISTIGSTTHDAASNFFIVRLQLTAWSADWARARAARDRVRELLDATVIAGARGCRCVFNGAGKTYDETTTPRMHGALIDFTLMFNV